MNDFRLTPRQEAAQEVLASDATHIMLFGGSRSGKTFLLTRNVIMRALKAPKSRHAILRFRFNAVKSSVVMDTFPKAMAIAFPGVRYTISKSDWFAEFENGSQIWFGGLDDKERAEKILGMEFATVYLNECSQIPENSRNIAVTRLAQSVNQMVGNRAERPLKPRMYYDCNPPSKAHWSYRMFVEKRDADKKPLKAPHDYASFQLNPKDNQQNVSADYLATLEALPARLRKRFLSGEFAEATPNALWTDDVIDRWRVVDQTLPDMQRIVVAVDPSGADDENSGNDAIGITVCGLGVDGNGYLLEDLTITAGPATWGNIATTAFDRWDADEIVGEVNYGGAMVKFVIQTSRQKTPFRMVTASRGKAVRAEPISVLYEQGRIRHAGEFPELEDELCAFSTSGYLGENSPNRADAAVWGFSALFPGIIKQADKKEKKAEHRPMRLAGASGWMA